MHFKDFTCSTMQYNTIFQQLNFQIRSDDRERFQFGVSPTVHVKRHGVVSDRRSISIGTFGNS